MSDDDTATWVEQRIFDFLDAYQRLDRGGEDFAEEVVTDPECFMCISRAEAVASEVYRGHPYFFCSQECQEVSCRRRQLTSMCGLFDGYGTLGRYANVGSLLNPA